MKCQTEIQYSKEVVATGENDGPSFMVSYFEFPASDSPANQNSALRTVFKNWYRGIGSYY